MVIFFSDYSLYYALHNSEHILRHISLTVNCLRIAKLDWTDWRERPCLWRGPFPVNVRGLRKPGDWGKGLATLFPGKRRPNCRSVVFDTIVIFGDYFSCYGSYFPDYPYLVLEKSNKWKPYLYFWLFLCVGVLLHWIASWIKSTWWWMIILQKPFRPLIPLTTLK